jgi:sugar lactone lactonase YvrE
VAKIECVVDSRSQLGEGTLWDPREQVLWWVDIWRRLIHRYNPQTGRDDTFDAPQDLGCLAVRERGGLIVTMTDGFFFFDPATGLFDKIIDPEAHIPENRFNDGKTDRQGRFWAGTMHDKVAAKTGALYRLDTDLTCHRMFEGVVCSNALAWSPDSRTMYFSDSFEYCVWAFDFDPASGEIDNRRVFIDTRPTGGLPDGATVDAEGCYWVTLPHTGKVSRYDPAGKLMDTLVLPTNLPTCAGFGGRDLDILFVTTAILRREESELAGQSFPGGLFALDVGVKGLPEAHFLG